MKDNNKTKAIFITLAVCSAALLIVLTAGILTGGRNDSSDKPGISQGDAAATEAPADSNIISFTAIIEDINLDTSSIQLYSIDSSESISLQYNGATDIRNKHGKMISASLLTKGYIAQASYDSERLMLTSLKGSRDTWEYRNIRNLIVDADIGKITVSDSIYRYDGRLHILSGEDFIDLSAVNSLDVFTIAGIDNYVYLIKVTSGHGYLELANEEDFIGGNLILGRDVYAQVTEGMRVMLAEGNYKVKVENGEYSGSADIKINRDATSVFDVAEYGSASVEYGEVKFNIRPEGTELYIDGVKTLYDEAVKLTCKTHSVEAVLGGYTSYKGSIEVTNVKQTYNIALQANPEGVDEDMDPDDLDDGQSGLPDVENGPTPGGIPDSTTDDSDDASVTGTPVPTKIPSPAEEPGDNPTPTPRPENNTPTPSGGDGKYGGLIIIKCTENAAVYVDDKYVGTITGGSVSFSKQVGTLDVRLELKGYVTKNYTVEVEPGNSDVEFSFPDMVKKN